MKNIASVQGILACIPARQLPWHVLVIFPKCCWPRALFAGVASLPCIPARCQSFAARLPALLQASLLHPCAHLPVNIRVIGPTTVRLTNISPVCIPALRPCRLTAPGKLPSCAAPVLLCYRSFIGRISVLSRCILASHPCGTAPFRSL